MTTPVTREFIEELIVKAEEKGDTERVKILKESLENFKEPKPEMHHVEDEDGRHIVSLGGPPIVRTCGTPRRILKKVEE
jgi:hypothetical protein